MGDRTGSVMTRRRVLIQIGNSDLTRDQKRFPEGNERREGSLRLNWDSCIILIHHLYCQEIITVAIYSVPLMWKIMGTKTLFPFPEP